MWGKLIPYFNITSADRVLIVGAAYGWSCEIIEAETGAVCLGVDTSSYIHSTKDLSDRSEIEERIIEAGLDPTQGRGLELLNKYSTSGPRTNAIVLQEDMSSNQAKDAIRAAFGGVDPTRIYFENMIWHDTTRNWLRALTRNALDMTTDVAWLSLPEHCDSLTWTEIQQAVSGAQLVNYREV
jgi:hypothetical protein